MSDQKTLDPSVCWDLSPIFADRAAWEAAYREAEQAVSKLPALRGTLAASADSLKRALDKLNETAEKVTLVYLYANLSKCKDNGNPDYQEMEGKALSLYVSFSGAVSFFDPEVLSFEESVLESYRKDPGLSDYLHILDDTVRARIHTLDEEREKMLALLGDASSAPSDIFNMFEAVDLTFPDVEDESGKKAPLTHGSFGIFRESANRTVRETAFRVYHSAFSGFRNTLAATYAGSVKNDDYYAKVRGYSSSVERALFSNNVPVSVYQALIEAVHDSLPIMKDYLELRKQALGLEELHLYDLYAPIVDDIDYPVSYEEAKEMVLEATKPLGERYQSLLKEAYANRWIDVYETKGKTTGAFSCGVYGVHPYVLLNYSGRLDDAYTLAHELGHSMHSYFSSEANSFANHDYRILVAEVASTVNEVFMTRYLLSKETDKKRRAYILNQFLEGFRTTVFRQTLFAEFEWKAHELYASGTPLTADVLGKLYHDLNALYYDGAVIDDFMDIEWARIPHFYNAFYVYQYATGFCSAVSIVEKILSTNDPSDYLLFLSKGGSDYPLEELKIAGVDLTKPDAVCQAMSVFRSTLDELKELLTLP